MPVRSFAFLVVLITGTGVNAEKLDFARIEFSGNYGMPIVHDLDRDGHADLLFQFGRKLHLHFFRPGTGYSTAADQVLSAPADAAMLDVGEVDGAPETAEILFCTRRGAEYLVLGPEAPRRFGAKPIALAGVGMDAPLPFESSLRYGNILLDANGDGEDDLLLPSARGYDVYLRRKPGSTAENEEPPGAAAPEKRPEAAANKRDNVHQGAAAFAPPSRLVLPLRGRVRLRHWNLVGSHEAALSYPLVYPGEYSGDDRGDLLFFDGDTFSLCRGLADGAFESRPSSVISVDLRDVNLMPDQRKGARPSWNPVDVRDLDGDGKSDIVINEMRTGIVRIYRGSDTLRVTGRPDALVRIGEWNLGVRFTDMDGDGYPDLVVPGTAKVGLGEALRIVMTQGLTVTHYLHRNRGSTLFGGKPDGVLPLRIPLDIQAESSQNTDAGFSVQPSMLIDYDGDYDGDGRGDLLVLTQSDRLSIHMPGGDGVWGSKPSQSIIIPDTDGFRRVTESVHDLDGDGRSDIYLRYSAHDAAKRKGLLLLSSLGKSRE